MIRWFPGWRTCLLSSTLLFCLSFSFSTSLCFVSHTVTSSHISFPAYFKRRLHSGIKKPNNSRFIACNQLIIKFKPSVTRSDLCPCAVERRAAQHLQSQEAEMKRTVHMVEIQNGSTGGVGMLELAAMLFPWGRVSSVLPRCQGFTVSEAGCEPTVGFTVRDYAGEGEDGARCQHSCCQPS